MSWLARWWRGRPFEAFQIEVTARCNLRCIMCPRTALAGTWADHDLSREAFQRVVRAFGLARWVHLQGWGEPRLHPRLFEMIRAAKTAGCRVGFTTNAMLLDGTAGGPLLDLELDLLAVSIAGATARTHESIRVGSRFSTILWHLGWFLTLRRERKRRAPKVEVCYLMTATNMAELPQAVELAASLGADEIVATNLDYVVTAGHDALRVFERPDLRSKALRALQDARERAQAEGIAFRAYPVDLEEAAVCEANPLKNLFISSDGWVSPCTYLGLPGRADIPRWVEGRPHPVPRPRFGNIQEQDLLAIWEGAAYREFRRQFSSRVVAAALSTFGAAARADAPRRHLPPPPDPCRTCPKLLAPESSQIPSRLDSRAGPPRMSAHRVAAPRTGIGGGGKGGGGPGRSGHCGMDGGR